MFKQGETWTHLSLIDLNIYITKVSYSDAKCIKLKVIWVNRWWPNILHNDSVEIKAIDFWKWSIVDDVTKETVV